MAWCGFFGAWLLVAGPLDQAVRELEDQDFEHAAIRRAKEKVGEPPEVSSWWMLLPPVWWVMRQRRDRKYHHEVGRAMEDEEVAAYFSYRDVAGAWIYVAAGAALIGVESTWGLRESYEWPEWIWAALVIVAVLTCGATTKLRRHRRHRRAAMADAAGVGSTLEESADDGPIAD